MSCVAFILNYNDSENTINLTSNLIKMNNIDQVVVVDNDSNDYNKEKILDLNNFSSKVTLIQSDKNLYYTGGTNYGLKYIFQNIKADYILIINSDVLVEEDVLNICIDKMNKDSKLALCSPQMLDHKLKIDNTVAWKEKKYINLIQSCFYIGRRIINKKYYTYNTKVDCIRGSFQLFRYSIIENIGGYDSNVYLYYAEDILGLQVRKIGYHCEVFKECTYVHNHPPRKRVNTKQFKLGMKDMYYFYKTYKKNNMFSRLLLRICITLGVFEHYFIDLYFKLFRRNK